MSEQYEKNGMVAILISSGFGSGWSTGALHYDDEEEEKKLKEEILYDPEMIQLVLDGTSLQGLEEVARRKWPDMFLGGLRNAEVVWLKKGTAFRILEYDGYESLEIKEEVEWMIA